MTKSLIEIDGSSLIKGCLKLKRGGKAPDESQVSMWQSVEMGSSASEVAAFHGVEVADVKKAVSAVTKFVASAVAVDVAAFKMLQHMRYEGLIHESLKGYKDSGGLVQTKVVKRNAHGDVIEETITEKEVVGDPRFLTAVDRFLSAQRDLWPGANAPKATALTNSDGTGDAQINIAAVITELTAEEREAVCTYGRIMMSRGLLDA